MCELIMDVCTCHLLDFMMNCSCSYDLQKTYIYTHPMIVIILISSIYMILTIVILVLFCATITITTIATHIRWRPSNC